MFFAENFKGFSGSCGRFKTKINPKSQVIHLQKFEGVLAYIFIAKFFELF